MCSAPVAVKGAFLRGGTALRLAHQGQVIKVIRLCHCAAFCLCLCFAGLKFTQGQVAAHSLFQLGLPCVLLLGQGGQLLVQRVALGGQIELPLHGGPRGMMRHLPCHVCASPA